MSVISPGADRRNYTVMLNSWFILKVRVICSFLFMTENILNLSLCVLQISLFTDFLRNSVQFGLFLILLLSTVIIHRLRIGRANWVKIADDIRGCYQMYFTRLTGLWNHKHSLIELTVGDKKCNIEIISIVYIILFLAILFSFCGPLLWNNAKIFTPYKQKNHTKTNNCTGCVYTEYWGKYLPSFSFFYGNKVISITKLTTSWQSCKKTSLRYF